MAILRASDASKLTNAERNAKLKELRLELVKSNVSAKKATSKTKEIKRAIARCMTFNRQHQEASKK